LVCWAPNEMKYFYTRFAAVGRDESRPYADVNAKTNSFVGAQFIAPSENLFLDIDIESPIS